MLYMTSFSSVDWLSLLLPGVLELRRVNLLLWVLFSKLLGHDYVIIIILYYST